MTKRSTWLLFSLNWRKISAAQMAQQKKILPNSQQQKQPGSKTAGLNFSVQTLIPQTSKQSAVLN